MLGARRRHRPDDRAVIGIAHLDPLVEIDALAGDPHALVADGGSRFRLNIHRRSSVHVIERNVENIEIAQLAIGRQ